MSVAAVIFGIDGPYVVDLHGRVLSRVGVHAAVRYARGVGVEVLFEDGSSAVAPRFLPLEETPREPDQHEGRRGDPFGNVHIGNEVDEADGSGAGYGDCWAYGYGASDGSGAGVVP